MNTTFNLGLLRELSHDLQEAATPEKKAQLQRAIAKLEAEELDRFFRNNPRVASSDLNIDRLTKHCCVLGQFIVEENLHLASLYLKERNLLITEEKYMNKKQPKSRTLSGGAPMGAKRNQGSSDRSHIKGPQRHAQPARS